MEPWRAQLHKLVESKQPKTDITMAKNQCNGVVPKGNPLNLRQDNVSSVRIPRDFSQN
jgi:hypothetical protein